MKIRTTAIYLLLAFSALTLTGCPGSGDRLKADETATVSQVGANICFQVPQAQKYQPTPIAINPRGTPPQKLSVTDMPKLTLKNGRLCITPDFYRFPEEGQFIVQYILESSDTRDAPRSIVTGIELSGSQVKTFPLTHQETTRH